MKAWTVLFLLLFWPLPSPAAYHENWQVLWEHAPDDAIGFTVTQNGVPILDIPETGERKHQTQLTLTERD